MLRAHKLEMTFNPGTPIENRVLRGLDLEIPTGQFVTVMRMVLVVALTIIFVVALIIVTNAMVMATLDRVPF